MNTILRESYQIARKDYECDACELVLEGLGDGYYTFFEKKEIVRAKRNEWKIKKGDKYFLHVGISDGDFYRYREIIAMRCICLEYDLFDEG